MSENGSTVRPLDLITDDLVKEAVKQDIGKEAKVISWDTKDFTNKGDNYSSIVTSITVKFLNSGKICETSYVAKLNPLRPASSLTDLMEDMYGRETLVLGEIFGEMNSQLKKLNLPPIKAPRVFASCLEKRKEAIITENLRTQGFMMYDRKKGMDIKHALLVVEELGRLHASSLLYEQTLHPKTIPETFDHFEEPWSDVNHLSFKFFNAMLTAQCKGACEFLKIAPEYDKCSKWLNARMDLIGKLFVEGFSGTKPMETLTHGDCWTNNILFKYDEAGNPVDIRFVDLQCARKASPASDMNYFYYTSFNGDVRRKYMKTMEKTYYDSFQNVFELAGKEPPYTFTEFEAEMMKRKQFGLMAGLLAVPNMLAEAEDELLNFDNVNDDNLDEFMKAQRSNFSKISERKDGPFRERFLSMFDEMLEYNIFDD